MEEFKPSKKIIRTHTHDDTFGIYGVQASDVLASDIQASKKYEWMNTWMLNVKYVMYMNERMNTQWI